MPYIVSTQSAGTCYSLYNEKGELVKIVEVNGGHGVMKRRGGSLDTPLGVTTPVTDEELELLRANPHFRRHESGGFVMVIESGGKPDSEKVAADMVLADGASPLTVTEIDKGSKRVPKSEVKAVTAQ